jgi:hypothetical protein
MTEFIKEYKGYVYRRLGQYLIAIPKDALCFVHKMLPKETNEDAFDQLKKLK